MAQKAGHPALPDGYAVHRFDTIDSTNAEALRRDARHGDVFVADVQTMGRGRGGRSWRSPPGNLYATLVVEPPGGRNPAQLAFVAALAVRDALAEAAPSAAFTLKWPNDVLAGGRKLAGILIEGTGDRYVVGIGVNLGSAPPDDAVRFPATSLRTVAGVSVAPGDLLAAVCSAFDAWFGTWRSEGFEPLRGAWLASAYPMGDIIRVSTGSGTIEGRFRGLDRDGALIVEDVSGRRRVIAAGDVLFAGVA